MNLDKSAETVVKVCMGLKENESCLIVSDVNKQIIASALESEARKITNSVKLVLIPIPNIDGTEPPIKVSKEMEKYDVIIMPTSRSLSWTNARKNATSVGARIASMPSITEDIMRRTLSADYNKIKQRTMKIIELLSQGKIIKITSKNGTNYTAKIDKKNLMGSDSGMYTKKGTWGNLPSGEAFFPPIENDSNGIVVIDASMASVGKIKTPIKITIENGFATKIEGELEAEKLKSILEGVNDKNAYNVAEIGIGTNDKATIIGNILEDEKVMGTCHVALGANAGMGGSVQVACHLDGIIMNPTIKIDGKELMVDGKFTYSELE